MESKVEELESEIENLKDENIELANYIASQRTITTAMNRPYKFHIIKVENMYDVQCMEKVKELIDEYGSYVFMKKLENL